MNHQKLLPTSALMYSFAFFILIAFSLSQNSILSNHSSKRGQMLGISPSFENMAVQGDEIQPTTNSSYWVINRGNTKYNGYSLRLNIRGVLMASEPSQYTGSRWELVSLGGNLYQFINRGNSDYNGWALRLNVDGSLIASSETNFTGCRWELESLGNNHFRVINRGNSNFNGYALCIRDGILTVSKDIYFTGCRWELTSQ